MMKRAEAFLAQLVLLIDAAVLIVAFVCTYFLRQFLLPRQLIPTFSQLDLVLGREALGPLRPLESYLWLLLMILPLWVGMLSLMGGYRQVRIKSYGQMTWGILKACLLGLLFFGSIVFILKLHYVSRTFMVFFFLLSVLLLSLDRAAFVAWFHLMLRRGYFHRNLLVVGTGPRAIRLIQTIQDHTNWGLRIIGVVDDDLVRAVRLVTGQSLEGVSVLGTLDQLPRLLREHVVDEVIFVVPRNWMSRIEQAILECELAGIRATVAVDLFNMRFAKAQPSDLEGTPLISFDATPIDEWPLAVKRLIDVIMAGIGLLLLLLVVPVIVALIKATSPGPVLFRQVRCGLNGRRFALYKFRSMVADAEAKQAQLEHLNELNGPAFKATNDPRLTAIGKWLRKTSIDELPQLLNVLKGEMSLVGPRPPIPSEVGHYESWQRRRLSMRPGMTGYWQVNGRNHITDVDRWMQLDLEYIDRWSLWLDAKILLKTLPTVLFGIGAK